MSWMYNCFSKMALYLLWQNCRTQQSNSRCQKQPKQTNPNGGHVAVHVTWPHEVVNDRQRDACINTTAVIWLGAARCFPRLSSQHDFFFIVLLNETEHSHIFFDQVHLIALEFNNFDWFTDVTAPFMCKWCLFLCAWGMEGWEVFTLKDRVVQLRGIAL